MRFIKGEEIPGDGSYHVAYGIDDLSTGHGNKIEVYGDKELRDLIIELLNKYYAS